MTGMFRWWEGRKVELRAETEQRVRHHLEEGRYEELEAMLRSQDPVSSVAADTLRALVKAVKAGRNIIPLCKVVEELLVENHYERGPLADELVTEALNRGQDFSSVVTAFLVKEFAQIFASSENDFSASHVGYYRSVQSLEALESALERKLQEWQRKQPRGIISEKMTARINTAQFMAAIAKRKSKLAKKNDGELLAGETIRLPRNRPGKRDGIYRMPR